MKFTQQQVEDIITKSRNGISQRGLAAEYGCTRSLIRKLLDSQFTTDTQHTKQVKVPSGHRDIDELLDYKTKSFNKKIKAINHSKLLPVKIKTEGPIGVSFFGDPHLDDPYCNIPLLQNHLSLLNKPYVFGACPGDYRNNWVGRLQKLLINHDITGKETEELMKWFFGSGNWLFLMQGNHDADWSHGGNIIDYMLNDDAINAGD